MTKNATKKATKKATKPAASTNAAGLENLGSNQSIGYVNSGLAEPQGTQTATGADLAQWLQTIVNTSGFDPDGNELSNAQATGLTTGQINAALWYARENDVNLTSLGASPTSTLATQEGQAADNGADATGVSSSSPSSSSAGSASTTSATAAPGADQIANASAILDSILQQAGFQANSPVYTAVNALIQNGTLTSSTSEDDLSTYFSSPTILSGLSSSLGSTAQAAVSAWNNRFAGNVALQAAGQAPLSLSNYISAEQSYEQIMQNFGVNADTLASSTGNGTMTGANANAIANQNVAAQLIGGGVSASEFQTRLQDYSDIADRQDPGTLQELSALGMSKSDLLNYLINPAVTAPLVQQKYQQVLIGAAAANAGVQSIDQNYISQLAAQGVTADQASSGFEDIAQNLSGLQTAAQAAGTTFTQQEMEDGDFNDNGADVKKRQTLASQNRALFNQQAGVQAGASGSLRKDITGSF